MSAAALGMLEQLNTASSAEDFFAMLGVDYDPKHLNVVRLHILRRMGQYLVSEDFAGRFLRDIAQPHSPHLSQFLSAGKTLAVYRNQTRTRPTMNR